MLLNASRRGYNSFAFSIWLEMNKLNLNGKREVTDYHCTDCIKFNH